METARAFVDELASLVAAKVLAELRRNPVVQQQMFNAKDAAVFLGRSPSAVRHLVVSGKLVNDSCDSRVQFSLRQLEAFTRG